MIPCRRSMSSPRRMQLFFPVFLPCLTPKTKLDDPMEALEKAKEWAERNSMDEQVFKKMKTIYVWTVDPDGLGLDDCEQGIDFAEQWASDLTPEQFETLKTAYAWITDPEGMGLEDPVEAIEKSEDMATSIYPGEFVAFKTAYDWAMNDPKGPSLDSDAAWRYAMKKVRRADAE